MVRATALIPTHDHGQLLSIAAESALGQTVSDLELFIVLDGADPATTDAADQIARADNRVRLFAHEKGARRGEAYRHLALQEAQGRIVCYLSDDDIWYTDHVEYLERLLQDSDFAHSQTLVVQPGDETSVPYHGNLEDPWFREWLTGPYNFIPLSAAGHTLTAYRSLPVGWSPAPVGIWTDLHMWRKFLAAPGLRFSSGGRPSVVHFPSPFRAEMTPDDRLEEMRSWWDRLRAPGGWQALRDQAVDRMAAQAAANVKQRSILATEIERLRPRLAASDQAAARLQELRQDLEAEVSSAHRAASCLQRERATLLARVAASDATAARLTADLSTVTESLAYRASRRMANIPVIGRIGRWVAAALVGRRGR